MNAKTTMEQGHQVWAMIHGHIEDKKRALTPPFHWMVSAKVGVISKREYLLQFSILTQKPTQLHWNSSMV